MAFLKKIIKIPKKAKAVKGKPKLKTPKTINRIEYSKILAREILITETFINRLKKSTDRPIVVIGNGGTGKPYTWTIKKQPGLYLRELNYPSSGYDSTIIKQAIEKLNLLMDEVKINIEKKTGKKPIIVFVDASREGRMPSSFVGKKEVGFLQKKDSLLSYFEKQNKKVSLVGYNWALKNNSKYLPKAETINKNDVILFNPVRDREQTGQYSAFHDDKADFKNRNYKNYVKKKVNLLKNSLFGK